VRSKLLFPGLLLLALSLACSSNKSSDQGASNAPGGQPNASTPASSETGNGSSSMAKSLGGPSSEKPRPEEAAVIPAGTHLTVRTQERISSGTAQSGDAFSATLTDPITVDGRELVPAGSKVDGTVAEAQARGKIKGAASLRLELTRLTVNGNSYPIRTTMDSFAAKGKGKRTAVATGGGAALGGIIGGIAGGGKGAAIGLLAGAGAGLAGGTLTGNKQIELPAETALTFKLTEAVTLK